MPPLTSPLITHICGNWPVITISAILSPSPGLEFQFICLCRSPRIALRPSAPVNRIVSASVGELTLTSPLTGLSQCKLNEGLLTKAIKQQEKLHDVDAARGMLSALRHESIERVWKVTEGNSLWGLLTHRRQVVSKQTDRQAGLCALLNSSWHLR